jgi:hypothetical protein
VDECVGVVEGKDGWARWIGVGDRRGGGRMGVVEVLVKAHSPYFRL